MELTLDQKLKFEFANLDIKGANIESFYSYRFELFLFENSEIPPKGRFEAVLTGQIYKYTNEYTENEKYEMTISRVLSEKTFIQDQLTRHERNLNEILHPDNREKLNIWVDYLKQKNKAIGEIILTVPPWTKPLISLYMIYKLIGYNDNNVKAVCKQLGYDCKDFTEIKNNFYLWKVKEDRIYSNIDLESEKGKADAQLNRLKNLKLIMEDRKENETKAYTFLLTDIKELNKTLGYF